MLIDSHCHLDNRQFDSDREEVIQRALDAGVGRMVVIGTGDGPPDLEAGIRLAERYDAIYATVGVHPNDTAKAEASTYQHLAPLLRHPKVVALGEIGLDYHHRDAPPEIQKAAFLEQMRIGAEARKPIIIHTREAWEDTFAMIAEHWAPHGLPGIMHCFSGGPAEAARALELGFYLSFGGIVTYPKSVEVQEAARMAPLDRILVETDSPYLAPVPRRGKRNEPALVVHTAAKLADLKGIPADELAAATSRNFERLAGRALN